ncbi:DUF5696 domain-containing protein [Haploplasma axanthum]|nr:DUF5696 domain-containing protein [Haploplasma axanthum]
MFKTKKFIISFIIIGITLLTLPFVFGDEKEVVNDKVEYDEIISDDYQFKSNKYTQGEEDNRTAVNDFGILDDTYKLLGKNELNNVSLHYNKDDLSFVVVDHNSGYIWNSKIDASYLEDENSPLNDEGDIGANNLLRRRMKSPVIVSYYIGTLKRDEGLFDGTAKTFTVQEMNGKIGFEANVTLPVSGIKFKLIVSLDDNGLNVEIPASDIKDGTNGKLSNINVYPYFGSTKRTRIPGYVFIPDGIGALIRFDDTNKGIYTKKFYGPNYSLAQQSTNEEYLYANLFGIVHGVEQNGLIGIADKGSAYASLVSYSARSEDDFNKTFMSFEYRVLFTQYLNASKTNSVRMVQENVNRFDAKVTYKFLNGSDANYIGMANSYREYLNLDNNANSNNNISLHLNVLAAENKPTLFGKKTFSMTRIDELINILDELNNESINNIDVTYHGWQNNGYSNSNVKFSKVNGKIGNKKDLKELIEKYGENIYFNVDYTMPEKGTSGFSSKDVLQAIDQSLLINEAGSSALNYNYILNSFKNDYNKKLNKLGIENISFDNLSKMLLSDFSKNGLSREEAIAIIKENLDVSTKTAVERPFSYLWNTDLIFDVPLYSSNQGRFSDTVPFIPIVLENKTVYGRASNFFSNKTNEVLRMIDYNIYPSFYITHESSNLLLETKSNNIYTSRFSDWKTEILDQYNYINEALKNVINQKLVKREIINTGLVKNTYNNGVVIYINYSSNEYTDAGVVVSPSSYEVIF